jgi:predicted nucleic acid-binding protein
VIDASVAASWCLADEARKETTAVLDVVVSRTARVPPLWEFEVANALLSAERQGRISRTEMERQLAELEALPIHTQSVELSKIIFLAHQYELTIYDAAYLALAFANDFSLATTDGDVKKAALQLGVNLLIK